MGLHEGYKESVGLGYLGFTFSGKAQVIMRNVQFSNAVVPSKKEQICTHV